MYHRISYNDKIWQIYTNLNRIHQGPIVAWLLVARSRGKPDAVWLNSPMFGWQMSKSLQPILTPRPKKGKRLEKSWFQLRNHWSNIRVSILMGGIPMLLACLNPMKIPMLLLRRSPDVSLGPGRPYFQASAGAKAEAWRWDQRSGNRCGSCLELSFYLEVS